MILPTVLVWEGGGDSSEPPQGAESALWSNSSAVALDARRAVQCGARLVRLQWRRADAGGAAAWRDADLTSLHHHREVLSLFIFSTDLRAMSSEPRMTLRSHWVKPSESGRMITPIAGLVRLVAAIAFYFYFTKHTFSNFL